MADSEDEVDLHAGLSLPTLGGGGGSSAAPLSDDDDDDEAPKEQGAGEDSDAEPGSGLPNADAAFTVDGSAYELDPFRIAGPSSAAGATEAGPSASTGPAGAGKLCSKLFVAGLPYDLDDAGLIKAFSRYGKVQEASVARAEGGKSRGFGFVTYVHLKGARFCMEQLGDPPVFEIGGRSCTVRFSEARSSGPAHYRMPARGQYDPAPRRSGAEAKAPGGPPAPKRVHEEGEARLTDVGADGGDFEGGDGYGGGGKAKRKKKKKEEIVTVSKRQDAEPLYDKKLTMKELFSKEFWRI